jgi:D-aspartate ligase
MKSKKHASRPLDEFGPVGIVLGLSPTGVYVIRELGNVGIPVVGVSNSLEPGRYSHYLSAPPIIEKNPKALLARLLEIGSASQRTLVLIPTSDLFIEFLVRHRESLAPRFRFQESYNREVYSAIVDKRSFSELCIRHRVDHPRCWVRTSSELVSLADEIRYPSLLKPAFIHLAKRYLQGRKVLIAPDRRTYQKLVSAIPDQDGEWLVQEIIPGAESELTLFGAYFDKDSTARQTFTGRKLRQYPPGFGSASLVRADSLEETAEISQRFLSAIGFHGVASAEFKRDPRDGRLKIIEVNPRPALWFAAAHHAGKRISLACFRELVGQPLPDEVPQNDRVVWRYLIKDLYSAGFYKMKAATFILPAPDVEAAFSRDVEKHVGPLFDRQDLGPVFGEGLRYLRRGVERVLQTRSRMPE